MLREARLHPVQSLALLALSALIGASNLGIPLLLEDAIDIAAGVVADAKLWPVLGALALIGLGRGAASWSRDTVLRRLRVRRISAIDRDLVARSFRAPRGALEPIGPGAAADSIASGDRVGAWLFGDLPTALAEAVTGLALLILLWSYDWRMGCLGTALVVFNTVLIWRLARREAGLGTARAEAEGALARKLEYGLKALDPIRLGGLEPIALAAWERALDQRANQLESALARGEAAAALQMAVSGTAHALVIGLGGYLLTISPDFTIGELFACAALVFAVNDPARRLLMAHAEASKATAELLRREALNALDKMPPAGTVPAGERYLVSGADETTWKRLAADRPGAVLLTAPTELLPGTVAENVTLFTPPDSARLFRALRLANLDRELMARGLDAPLGAWSSDLSTGQRQRLGIARAIYAGAPAILIAGGLDHLDRPTATALLQTLDTEGPSLLIADTPVTREVLAHWAGLSP